MCDKMKHNRSWKMVSLVQGSCDDCITPSTSYDPNLHPFSPTTINNFTVPDNTPSSDTDLRFKKASPNVSEPPTLHSSEYDLETDKDISCEKHSATTTNNFTVSDNTPSCDADLRYKNASLNVSESLTLHSSEYNLETDKDISCEKPPFSTQCNTPYNSDNIHDDDSIFDSDDSVFDKDYVPRPDSDTSSSTSIIPHSQGNIVVPESPELSLEENSNIEQDLTKKGEPRKRRRYSIPLAQRRKIKKNDTIERKYYLKPGCNEKCKKKCHTFFTQGERKLLNISFNNMTFREQKYFIKNCVSQEIPKRKTVSENRKVPRNNTNVYFLTNEIGSKINVCKVFFLETLGFKRNNDKVLRNALKYRLDDNIIDKRGKKSQPTKIDNTKIIEHIKLFNPAVAHHRREHAPNRKYIPSDLSVSKMYSIYKEQFPSDQVSYEHYRKVVKSMNISFTKLGHEECEDCEKYYIHNPHHRELRHRNCEECREYEKHHENYVIARQEYKKDVEQQNESSPNSDTGYFTADLQKVIMLPRMDQFKSGIFCPRIIVFNETFVPLGDKKLISCATFAAIWHEAISGRKKEDIISCFRAFLYANRDLKHVIIWLDNCAAQNKNWCLFCYLIQAVSSSELSFETITLKYLEVGHTFMSADEFHHQVELSMKKMKRLYDFEDFSKAVANTNRKIIVKNMNISDFYKFEDCSSTYKLQKSSPRAFINNMKEVTFRRGTHVIFYKNDFACNAKYELDFLKKKNIKSGIPPPKQIMKCRGIDSNRKLKILHKLGPLMPDNRRVFWHNLPVDDTAVDLTEVYEE